MVFHPGDGTAGSDAATTTSGASARRLPAERPSAAPATSARSVKKDTSKGDRCPGDGIRVRTPSTDAAALGSRGPGRGGLGDAPTVERTNHEGPGARGNTDLPTTVITWAIIADEVLAPHTPYGGNHACPSRPHFTCFYPGFTPIFESEALTIRPDLGSSQLLCLGAPKLNRRPTTNA